MLKFPPMASGTPVAAVIALLHVLNLEFILL